MQIYAKHKETGELISALTPESRSYAVLINIAGRIADYHEITEDAALTLLDKSSAEEPIELPDCVVWLGE